VHLLHLGEIVGEEGSNHPLQEHPGARVKESSQARHGTAAP
jgi:hypothetical protein